ncbi:MAG: DegT/DnrJ/EryC1/StrS family aminotransferase [Caldilineaceae bacterium]|nr:DegT/DnrJ/EryC1/StrS family aminotransferase [Caldilineaceae bacterium]
MISISKPFIGSEEKDAVLAVLESGFLVQGPRTQALEERFAALCNTRFAIATSNGTTALQLALLANEIGPGDEVITTPFTFIATVNSIVAAGATPVLVDIDPETFNLDAALVEAAITPRTKAIMPVHLYGQMCDMEALCTIARTHNLRIIEDAAQAVGATYKGQPAGSFGTGAFSLYATKNVMSAEGGMITTDDESVAERCRLLRNHGQRERYHYNMFGFNYRLSDLHAAIGLCQLDRLHHFTKQRAANAAYFNARLDSVVTPKVQKGLTHVWHQYTVRMDRGRNRERSRASAIESLTNAGVGTGIFYPVPAHLHNHVRKIVGDICLPVAEQSAQEVFSIPVHPQLSEEDRETIVAAVNQL